MPPACNDGRACQYPKYRGLRRLPHDTDEKDAPGVAGVPIRQPAQTNTVVLDLSCPGLCVLLAPETCRNREVGLQRLSRRYGGIKHAAEDTIPADKDAELLGLPREASCYHRLLALSQMKKFETLNPKSQMSALRHPAHPFRIILSGTNSNVQNS